MLAAVFCAALADWFYIPPEGSLALAWPSGWIAMGFYVITVATIIGLTHGLLAATEGLGASQEALIGQAAHALFHAPDPDGNAYPAESCYVTEAVRDGVTTVAEQDVYLRGDGSEVPVEVTASPLKDDGRTLGAVVVFRDITDRREVERLKDEFVSVVSHELRTPLTSIRGALGLLDSGTLGPLPEPRSTVERLRAQGRLTPAKGRLSDLPPPIRVDDPDIGRKIREALEEIRAKVPDTRGTRIVCRSGSPMDVDELAVSSHSTARSVIRSVRYSPLCQIS